VRRRKLVHQPVRDQQAQHPVAQEFQTLIVGRNLRPRALAHAGVGQGAFQKLRLGESMAKPTTQSRHGLGAHIRASARHQSRILKNRLKRTLANQLTGLNNEAPGVHENMMISALPTRFSAGTMPTPDDISTRLSMELSRLSPIMK